MWKKADCLEFCNIIYYNTKSLPPRVKYSKEFEVSVRTIYRYRLSAVLCSYLCYTRKDGGLKFWIVLLWINQCCHWNRKRKLNFNCLEAPTANGPRKTTDELLIKLKSFQMQQ